jgi:4-diphosphocytidyl-2-C-methyl-D-erythritol kinase
VTSPSDAVEAFAPAKVNLFLHVGEKRSDGFHDLESLVVFVEAGDTLSFTQSGELTLSVDGPFAKDLSSEGDNLVLRAAHTLASHAGSSPRAAITLTKNLPVASGIGGGSADAAATLRGLTRLWALDMSWSRLRAIAETLGSDVPVCVESKPSWMEGRGERIAAAGALPEMALVLVNPGMAVPTADVFRALKTRRGTGKVDHSARMLRPRDLIAFLKTTSNDLEAAARVIAPVIGEVLSELSRMPGVELWRMSGSGATCFALFEDESAAEMAAIALSHSHPDWWVQSTRLI